MCELPRASLALLPCPRAPSSTLQSDQAVHGLGAPGRLPGDVYRAYYRAPLLTGAWGAARMQTGRERDENCRRSKSRLVLETCTRG